MSYAIMQGKRKIHLTIRGKIVLTVFIILIIARLWRVFELQYIFGRQNDLRLLKRLIISAPQPE